MNGHPLPPREVVHELISKENFFDRVRLDLSHLRAMSRLPEEREAWLAEMEEEALRAIVRVVMRVHFSVHGQTIVADAKHLLPERAQGVSAMALEADGDQEGIWLHHASETSGTLGDQVASFALFVAHRRGDL